MSSPDSNFDSIFGNGGQGQIKADKRFSNVLYISTGTTILRKSQVTKVTTKYKGKYARGFLREACRWSGENTVWSNWTWFKGDIEGLGECPNSRVRIGASMWVIACLFQMLYIIFVNPVSAEHTANTAGQSTNVYTNKITSLSELSKLYENGMLTKEEFERLKQEVIGS